MKSHTPRQNRELIVQELRDKRAKEQAWREENRAAIEAYNERIEKFGTLIKPPWLKT